MQQIVNRCHVERLLCQFATGWFGSRLCDNAFSLELALTVWIAHRGPVGEPDEQLHFAGVGFEIVSGIFSSGIRHWLTCHVVNKEVSNPYRFDEGPATQEFDDPLEVIGQHMQAHLGADTRQLLGQEMRRPHPGLRVAKGCSTVCLRRRIASGWRSKRPCIASRTASCSQRTMRR